MLITLINPYFNTEDQWKNTHLINVTLLETLNRQSIINFLIQCNKIDREMINCNIISANPRSYYIDMLLNKNYQLYYDEDQLNDDHMKINKLMKLPLNLEIVVPELENYIDCQMDSVGLKHFNVLQKLGEGTYAEIFLVQKKYDRTLYCMKRINKSQCRVKGSLNMIKNEFNILQNSSKYNVKLYYQFEDTKYVYFILEYCVHGDLYSIIKSSRKSQENIKLTLTQKYTIWISIAFGIASLHQRGFIYRDLKPQNILLNQNGEVKICDFGFTCKIEPNQKLSQLCGSYQYLAPEIIKKEGYNRSLDIYCLGLLFYELLVGSNPYEGITPETILEMKSKPINFQKKSINPTVKDLLKKMLKQKAEERLGYQQILQIFKHDFFKQNQDLIIKIIGNKVCIKSLKFFQPMKVKQRQELDEKQAFIFTKGISFNYLKPFFDVTENIGPKFTSMK